MSVLLLAVAGWLVLGAVGVAVMHHRGHDVFSWAVLFVVLGPLALPIAVSSQRHMPPQPVWDQHDGAVDLLVAHDGSCDIPAGLGNALDLLGSRVTSVTLATVVDAEAATTVRGRDTQREAERCLGLALDSVRRRTDAPVDSVVLFGEPNHVLARFAAEHGYELIVGGAQLAKCATVPVLVRPAAR